MKKYEYTVKYLNANVKQKQVTNGTAGAIIATQVESHLNQMSNDGWELYQQFDTSVDVKPGCLGSLFGGTINTIVIVNTVFRKEI